MAVLQICIVPSYGWVVMSKYSYWLFSKLLNMFASSVLVAGLILSIHSDVGECQEHVVFNNVHSDYGSTAFRPIIISTDSSPLPKGYTVKLEVDHKCIIERGLALANASDLRVFYYECGDAKAREIDRIVKNAGTSQATVLFKLQEQLEANSVEKFKYILAYGKNYKGEPKQNPENVYLFFDDFSDGDLEKKWQQNWGISEIRNGKLEVRTGTTPTGNNEEVAVFVKNGENWKDVEVELSLLENNANSYPGPFVRLENASIENTSGWWLEYFFNGEALCVLRPIKNNRDSNWSYKRSLPKPLAVGTWYNTKYRVVGDDFFNWINNEIVYTSFKIPSTWMISKGTLGLGCHKAHAGNPVECHTLYDDVTVTKYVSQPPKMSLGNEWKVGPSNDLGTSKSKAATSCKQIHDSCPNDCSHVLRNGVYWIKTAAADHSVQTYCDLENGGWTLVGKICGKVGNVYGTWLVSNHDVDQLSSPALSGVTQLSCIDARYLATYRASAVRLASGENNEGIGSKWVEWSLPEAREAETLWTHSVGFATVHSAPMEPVTVKAWDGNEKTCYQNKFGIMPNPHHGGSYPSATYNTLGYAATNDNCMSVGVQAKGTTADGWIQNLNGFDAPTSNNDWRNKAYNDDSPCLTVWLK